MSTSNPCPLPTLDPQCGTLVPDAAMLSNIVDTWPTSLWQYLFTSLSTIVTSWLGMSVLLTLIWLFWKQWRDSKIDIICKDTPANKKILEALKPLIDSYWPTIYVPFAALKVYLCTDRKVRQV